MSYKLFIMPALFIKLLIYLYAFLPAMNIVIEKENKTMDL